MSTIETNITTDRECDHCGYNLKGLPMGGKCPECGSPVRRKSIRTSGFMSEEAPTRFVRNLQTGFLLASLAIIISVLGTFTGRASEFINVFAAFMWIAGIFFITLKRPGIGSIRPDIVLDDDRVRLTVRLLNLSWPAGALISAAHAALISTPSGGNSFAVGSLAVLESVIGIVSWIGMIPTSIYLAELAYWSSHDNLAHRMRGAAWILAVIGTLTAVMTGFGLLLNSGTLLFLAIFPSIIIFFTIIVYNFTFFQMAHVMHWVIKHQRLAASSFERVEERRKKEEKYKGRIVDDMPCDFCGYNLIGLEQGGSCPECGTLFTLQTGHAIRDPAKTPSYHDNSDLEVGEGENKGVFFNDQLDAYGKPRASGVPYTPETEVPDDGEIPLALNDEENSESPKDDSIKQDSRDIDGIEPISFA